jgi:hypothetical protein
MYRYASGKPNGGKRAGDEPSAAGADGLNRTAIGATVRCQALRAVSAITSTVHSQTVEQVLPRSGTRSFGRSVLAVRVPDRTQPTGFGVDWAQPAGQAVHARQ